jgi:hypothetical protein
VYVRQKTIKGHQYYYLVEGRRSGRRTKQKVIRYLGKHAGGSVLTHGTSSNAGTSLPSPPRVFVEEPQPTPSTDEAPAIDEKQPRKVRWIRASRKEQHDVEPEDIQVGNMLTRITRRKPGGRYKYNVEEWVVTSTRADGLFKAIPKKVFDKAVLKAECTAWLGAWFGAFHVITGHPPARTILMLFADTKHAETFSTDYAPPDALPLYDGTSIFDSFDS